MLNLVEAVRSNPKMNRLEIGDFLFAEFTCGIAGEKVGLWAHQDYFVHVLTGKKTWHTAEGVFARIQATLCSSKKTRLSWNNISKWISVC